MTAPPTTQRLDAPGGQLYYEVRGSGPLLLVIGQPMTSGPFGPLADLLATDHTVVTYDPHGLGLSTVDDPSLHVTPEVEADDLARLIDAVSAGPADVFATSGGAVAALAFAVRHPEKIATLIAHEPPVVELLPDARHIQVAVDDVADAYRNVGSGAAWGKFVSMVIHAGPVTEAGIPPATWPPAGQPAPDADAAQEPAAPTEKQRADDELFFLRMLKPFLAYVPDVKALRSGPTRVVIAVGETSNGEIAQRSTLALAERLGMPAIALPGDHAGFMADPEGFAAAVRQILAEAD
jgi:pimeloyl-ACP methyl ester carboxylesterase